MDDEINEGEDEVNEFDYDLYSKTPPRTKILRKCRERKHREQGSVISTKLVKSKMSLTRRNTVSSAYDELIEKSEDVDSDQGSKRTNKRNLKLLRGSERDLKLDITSAQQIIQEKQVYENGNGPHKTPQPSYQIESCKRFKSLSCRTFPCSKFTKTKSESKVLDGSGSIEEHQSIIECPKSRVDFHNTLSLLIRMGCSDKHSQERTPRRLVSREEHLWQNELKDVIWLELQAFHADRTPTEEDNYLCAARESVEPLLNEIMKYHFHRHARQYSTSNSDSGVEDDCVSCLSMTCMSCMEAQNEALKEIEDLMQRLEAAESLFPSGKAFAELYPLYSSPEFVGRVKAISLWYNMTKHQRMKLVILGKLLAILENKFCQWPMMCNVKDVPDSNSPSDSNSSTSSSTTDYLSDNKNVIDLYNVAPIAALVNKKSDNKVSPYRSYIEDILKTRALNKSLNFLDRLHQFVLRKAQCTLEKPEDDIIFNQVCFETEEEELMRYGCWSPEAKALNLPSYKASFLFLATVPLEVIHEFLRMRLEQKPENPSPLSVRQLMRELKDGLRIAVIQKKKLTSYIESAVQETKENVGNLIEKLKEFDKTLLRVFGDYLTYLEHWALLEHETFQKNLLEEEWKFSCEIIDQIPDSPELLANRFCYILSTMLKSIGETLLKKIEELSHSLSKDDEMFKQTLFSVCRKLQSLFNEQREMSIKTLAFCKTVFRFKYEYSSQFDKMLRDAVISFKCVIPQAIEKVQAICDYNNFEGWDELERLSMMSRTREISMQGFRFGFEFYREMSNNSPNENRVKLVRSMVQFANIWMKFVTERCERGRGMRPRWAYQGLEFLLTVCEPRNTKHLTEEEFEDLKKNMDKCISHVIGTAGPSTPDSGFYSSSPRISLEHIRARSRGSSPSPRPTYKSQRSNNSRKTSTEQLSPVCDISDAVSYTPPSGRDQQFEPIVKIKLPPTTHSDLWHEAIENLDHEIDDRRMKQNLIGRVVTCNASKKPFIKRYVNFTWQRGIKIGQGRFGKVYTAVNNNTGEMMAVKEITLQHNDIHTIKRIAEEVKILEGIVHRHLLKYYGVEVHKDEMLIFMEFCAEGTLESLVAASEKGLPELLIRRYTFQLVSGVACLHDHGIVHRDIKTANIFLTEEGNCLKIGDFGCATKIKSHTTMPGELQGFVGTQAYMAPEVFTQNMTEGHGRAADIWSVGCVVVEMASGKRPWSQFDSNYQIMFKVGMGQSPSPPDNMIEEGLEFLDRCFQHNPRDRATAQELLDLNFVKVGEDLL